MVDPAAITAVEERKLNVISIKNIIPKNTIEKYMSNFMFAKVLFCNLVPQVAQFNVLKLKMLFA